MSQRLKTVYIEQMQDYGTSCGVIVMVRPDTIQEWCLVLSLLRFGLVEAVEVTTRDASFAILFCVTPYPQQGKRKRTQNGSRVTWHAHQAIAQLSHHDLDLLLHFSLAFYAQGTLPVDHIDIEMLSKAAQTGKTLDLVIKTVV